MGGRLVCGVLVLSVAAWARVNIRRVPDGGIQPQVAVDAVGTVHMVYYRGDPAAGERLSG